MLTFSVCFLPPQSNAFRLTVPSKMERNEFPISRLSDSFNLHANFLGRSKPLPYDDIQTTTLAGLSLPLTGNICDRRRWRIKGTYIGQPQGLYLRCRKISYKISPQFNLTKKLRRIYCFIYLWKSVFDCL